jgi:hypothetical protein
MIPFCKHFIEYSMPFMHIFNEPLISSESIVSYFHRIKIDHLQDELIKNLGWYPPDSHWHGLGAVRMKERQGFHCFRGISGKNVLG